MSGSSQGHGFIFDIEYRNIQKYIAHGLRFLTKGMNEEYALEQ
jgi:hypothetical protein